MAFRKKASFILTHKPDILIIVECEHPDKLLYKGDTQDRKTVYGLGKISIKGLQYFPMETIVSKSLKTIMTTSR